LSKESENKFWYVILALPRKKTKKPSNNLLQNFRLFEKPTGFFIQLGYRSLYTCKNIGSRNYNGIATDRENEVIIRVSEPPKPGSWSSGYLKKTEAGRGKITGRHWLLPALATTRVLYVLQKITTYLPNPVTTSSNTAKHARQCPSIFCRSFNKGLGRPSCRCRSRSHGI
jgi:hypothetical protein